MACQIEQNLHSPPTLEVLAKGAAALLGGGGSAGRTRARAWGARGGGQAEEGVEDVLQGG